MKICIVSSCGGHLTEVRQLLPAYANHEYFYVLNERALLPADMLGKTYFIRHSERDVFFFVNLVEAIRLLWKERPRVILSTGAGPVVPFALIGRYLFRTHIVFIETLTRIHRPSITGRIMYRIAHRFYYQWASLNAAFPKGLYRGSVL